MKKTKKDGKKKKPLNKRGAAIILISAMLVNIVLALINAVVIGNYISVSDKLDNYRELQKKQIASVEDLCFGVGKGKWIANDVRSNIALLGFFMKDKYKDAYESVYNNICYAPLLLITGKAFNDDDRKDEEKSKDLLEKYQGDDLYDSSEFKVKDDAFNEVKW